MNEVRIFAPFDNTLIQTEALKAKLTGQDIKRAVAGDCTRLTKDYLNKLPSNRRNWPSTGFYKQAALGTTWDFTQEGIAISIENVNAPGAMRQRYYGGTISMKEKLLTIPAREEFYGHRATEFTNLRFVMFASGAKALVIGMGGTPHLSFRTGKPVRTAGAGARTAMMIAYWLVSSVDQQGDQTVIPDSSAYYQVAMNAIVQLVCQNKS